MLHQFISTNFLDEAIVCVTLKRPEKRNALNLALMEELCLTFEELAQNASLRVIILNAEGLSFCTGLDLKEAVDLLLAEKMAVQMAGLLTAVYSSPLVTIAALQGDAIAGGAGLVAACDFAIAAREVLIGFPETRRGLVAAQVSALLCRQMRMREVRELLLLGELVNTEIALSMGLVNRVVENEQLLIEAMRMAKLIIKGGPQATRDTKRLIDKLIPSRFADDLKIALSFHHSARHSEEAKEGIAAFLEKRLPKWEKN